MIQIEKLNLNNSVEHLNLVLKKLQDNDNTILELRIIQENELLIVYRSKL